jgi:histone H3/H4
MLYSSVPKMPIPGPDGISLAAATNSETSRLIPYAAVDKILKETVKFASAG